MTDQEQDQTPPPGFEPQVSDPGQIPGIEERPSDLIVDAEAEVASSIEEDGHADDGDDAVEEYNETSPSADPVD
jgi:hypothetical protein